MRLEITLYNTSTTIHSFKQRIYKYLIGTNKMHTFFVNVLIQLYCLRHVSNIQVFIIRKTCACSFMVFLACIYIKHILPSTRLLIWMHERNTIKLQVQVFVRTNTWMFETCRRSYNWITTLMKRVCFCWFVLHKYNLVAFVRASQCSLFS